MSKHTPGPWEVRQSENSEVEFDVMTPDGYYVAQAFEMYGVGERIETKANARLIAAAPDLLDICNSILSHFAGTHEDNIALPLGWGRYQQLRAAIAKAEGTKK